MIANNRADAIAEGAAKLIAKRAQSAIAQDPVTHVEEEIDAKFLKAKEWFESINQQQIEFGRYLAQLKEETKRQFGKYLEKVELVKAQMNKFIKAADIADTLPSGLLPKLGLQILLQLGQARNEEAIAHLTEEDTQLSTAQKIKEHRKPPKPKMPKPVMQWEKNQYGDGVAARPSGLRTLVIRLSDGNPALEFESGYKQSGLPLPLYISSLIDGKDIASGAWQQAQQELAEYIEEQGEEDTGTRGHGETALQEGFPPQATAFALGVPKAYPKGDTRGHGGAGTRGHGEKEPMDNNSSISASQALRVTASSSAPFAIGDKVRYCHEVYTVASLPDSEGDVLVSRPNGTTRFLRYDALAKAC